MTSWNDLYLVQKREVDWTSNRIQPLVEIQMPDGGWISYPLGVFIVATPQKKESSSGIVRDFEAYDKTLILKEDRITQRVTFEEGREYYSCMVEILESANISQYNIENSRKRLAITKEYEPGTEKLAILNDLAKDQNYNPFWVDEYGYFRTGPYVSPSDRSPDYRYADDEISVTAYGMEETLDMFDLPNVFHVTVTNPDREEALTATAENRNPFHPRSIANLGRRVVRYEELDDIADQASLQAYVDRLAYETSQIFGKVTLSTAIMPFHGNGDVLEIRNETLGINGKYSETDWQIPLKPGGEMSHSARMTIDLI